MKKTIFSALVALLAIGGAVESQAGRRYITSANTVVSCSANSGTLCTTGDFGGHTIKPQDEPDLPFLAPSAYLQPNDFKSF